MKINSTLLEKIVSEELDNFLKENRPDFRKMMKRDAAHASAKDPMYSTDLTMQNQKDKERRLAQKNVSGSRDIEIKEEADEEQLGDVSVFVALDDSSDVIGVYSSIEAIEEKNGEEHGYEILEFALDGDLIGFVENKNKFPKTTPPKTSDKSSKMISQAVGAARDKKGEAKK